MKEKRWAIIRIGTLKHCNLSTIPKRTCKSERPQSRQIEAELKVYTRDGTEHYCMLILEFCNSLFVK